MLNLSARKVQILIGGADFSSCLVSLQGSDDHVNSGNGLITFNGQMVLGKSQGFNQSLDDRKNPTRYCRGVQVLVSIANTTGTLQRHPRGSLRILKSSYDDETKRLTLELGDLISLLNFKEPTNPDEANNKSLEGKTGGYIITRFLQVAGINAISGNLPNTTYNYPLNLSGSYLDTVGKLLYAHNLIGWIDKNEIFQIRPCDITGGGAGVAINVGETELYYKRLSGAETPVEKVKAVGNESVVSESPDYLRDYSEKIGLASGIHPDYPDKEIIIESVERIETWDKNTHTKIVTETTKKPYGIIIPEVFWNVTPSGEIISRLDRLIDAEIIIKTYKYSHDKETNILTNAQDETYETRGGCRLISLVEEIYQPRGSYLGEVKEARDNYNINELVTVLTKTITTNYTYTEKDIIKLITSNTLEMDVIIKNGTDEAWDAYTGFEFEFLVPSGKQTQEWKKITKDTWEYKSSGTGCLVRINKDAVIFKNDSETDSNKLTLIPNPELSIRRDSNSGQEQPPATERCPAEVNIKDKQIKVSQLFADACNNGLKPRERTFSVDLLAGRLEPYLAPGEAIQGLSVDSEARTQLRAIALREGRLLRGRDEGQQIATNIQDTLFNYHPLYPVNCKEKDGTVQAYLADGSSWLLSATRALWSCDGIWIGTFAGSPTIEEGIEPSGDIIRFYSEPIIIDLGIGIGFNMTSFSYALEKELIEANFGIGNGFNPFITKALITSTFGMGIGFKPSANVIDNFGIGIGFDPQLISPIITNFGIGVGFNPSATPNTTTDPYANNIVLFLKGDQSNLVTNTTTTADFTVPAINSTVTINVVSSGFATANRAIRVANSAGNYIITASNGTQITIRNCGGVDNAAAGNVINSGATIALSIIDSSQVPKALNAFGNTQISMAQSKYGDSSIYFDGTGDYLTTPLVSDLKISNSDFTFEAWVYRGNGGSSNGMILSSTPAVFQSGFLLVCSSSVLISGSGGGLPNLVSNLTVPRNQFNHVAVSRVGNNYYLSVNGIVELITNNTSWNDDAANTLAIGANARLDFPDFFEGYIDSLRITKGVARYTADFDPETDTYLNV